MIGDRDRGLSALNTYYQASGLQFSGITADQVVTYYDAQSPTFIETFGSAVRTALDTLSMDEVTAALSSLANRNLGKIPDYRDFIPALIDQTNGVSHAFRLVQIGAADGAKQAAGYLAAGAGVYALGAGVVAALLLFGGRR